jgi:hypothetical protein
VVTKQVTRLCSPGVTAEREAGAEVEAAEVEAAEAEAAMAEAEAAMAGVEARVEAPVAEETAVARPCFEQPHARRRSISHDNTPEDEEWPHPCRNEVGFRQGLVVVHVIGTQAGPPADDGQ